ncbi:efflux RND transporter periplasmic adaptor subunit [Sphingomonas crusticola]|uniref:efflux RND transporter periplasmic adaptor subunit n=1 Tax=Sphingomonas crusticola TaxID=1697973 RepID=UPI0013C31439|nr:efflux RND transporter periplasmic adaptor subunit [Sphingomonas crusticola]
MPEHVPEQGSTGSLKKIGIVALLVALAIVAWGLFSRWHSDRQLATWTEAQSEPAVSVIHPTGLATGDGLTLPGTLQAYNSAPIFARTNGYVRRWLVDIGDRVSAGQVLAILDAPEVDQQLAAARADLQTARANQELARSTAARWSNLLSKDAVSRQEADEKLGDLKAKSAAANAAAADVARLGATQGFTRLVAPFAGTITSRSTQIGQLVSAGTAGSAPLFTVSDISRIRIYVRVPQNYSGQIHVGMEANLTLPEYPGRTFTAVLTRTAGAVDPASGTVLVELQAANGDRALKPGSYAQVSFPLHGSTGTVQLPASALIVGQSGTQVALLGRDGKAVLKSVTVGRDNGATVEITAGLSPQDRVIDSPPDSLQAGDKVRIAPAAPAAGKPDAKG